MFSKKIILSFFLLYITIEYFIQRVMTFFLKPENESDILILKIDAIGDAVIWLDSAKEYKKHFPNKNITLLCDISWKEIAEKLPYFDNTISINKNRFAKDIKYRHQFLRGYRKTNYSLAISPVYFRDYFTIDSIIRNTLAKEKIGSYGSTQNTQNSLYRYIKKYIRLADKLKRKSDKFYTRLIQASAKPMMELSRNAEFIRNYLNPNFQSQLPEFPFEIPDYPNLQLKKYAVLFLGASTLRKVWIPISNYIEVVKQINESEIVLCGGGKTEEALGLEFQENVKPFIQQKVTNLIGKTSLIDLISVIKGAKYIITNDTSASHITVAVKTPSICILGGGHFGIFQPYIVEKISGENEKYLPKIVNYQMDCYNCNLRCIYINDKTTIYPCIRKITPEMVIRKIKEIELL